MTIDSFLPLNSQNAIDHLLASLTIGSKQISTQEVGQILIYIRKVKLQLYLTSKIEEHNRQIKESEQKNKNQCQSIVNGQSKPHLNPEAFIKEEKEELRSERKQRVAEAMRKAKERMERRKTGSKKNKDKNDGEAQNQSAPQRTTPSSYCYTHSSIKAISIPMGGKRR